ncbi:MAG: hypothetical protein ORN54_06255, partial [Cyclobacteriaceae bacterium]|nr:hypothetical protein [Cyclobacteriaceae bacterium]
KVDFEVIDKLISSSQVCLSKILRYSLFLVLPFLAQASCLCKRGEQDYLLLKIESHHSILASLARFIQNKMTTFYIEKSSASFFI